MQSLWPHLQYRKHLQRWEGRPNNRFHLRAKSKHRLSLPAEFKKNNKNPFLASRLIQIIFIWSIHGESSFAILRFRKFKKTVIKNRKRYRKKINLNFWESAVFCVWDLLELGGLPWLPPRRLDQNSRRYLWIVEWH